ncbi:related to flavin depend monooxygenase that catalyses the oxidation of rubrofusarin to 9-hydroxyrubrofusarin [Phialocephala subalpina]|uniref:Related to flavin depend monooxygenase that catalyses the oxidation of rubrofusarin to 9-hydroxyrubrofusarin n=1 Tax=Phialocephala subalpina TaxID=576137 RepID=A0A1L7XRA8_9HELO|nr:related to flavin depend monooxygenase that catalyses the oxidation of rubrofusarin to 9-hydroxyrubrofusarin [Phialocephala subalpina]
MEKQKVAVIGAGPSGLAATKNFLEVGGFDISVYEKRGEVGGVWSYCKDPNMTSTLKATVSNVSKFGNSFTDFPIPDGMSPQYTIDQNYDLMTTDVVLEMPAHLTAAQTCDYMKSYAKHFSLEQYIQFNTSVKYIKRNPTDTRWELCIVSGDEREEVKEFDKVVVCSGLTDRATTPKIEGMEKFTGEMRHVQAFKKPDEFKAQRVLVVGIGNSGADTSTQLIGHASKIYLSHRGGVKILPRIIEGIPLDLVINRNLNLAKFFLDEHFPAFSRWSFDYTIEGYSKKGFPNPDPSWRLKPAPSLANHQPIISDNLVAGLREKKITSVHGVKRFLGGKEVELSDGTKLEVDAVIWCTGYEPNFDIFRDYDPFAPVIPINTDKPKPANPQEPRLANLYQNMFAPKYASSLAVMNYIALTDGAFTVIDVATMALSQCWKATNPYPLPSLQEMSEWCSQHHAWVRSLTRNSTETAYTGIVRPGPYMHFLNEAAGTGVDDYLSYGRKGWGFWLKDRKMSGLMMRHVMTPFQYRYFEVPGRDGRKKWEGARDAILHANELAKQYKK